MGGRRLGAATSTAIATALLVSSCGSAAPTVATPVLGVDLSYVNEVEDCGATFDDGSGNADPFVIFAGLGANLVRARLWNNPDWTEYSTLEDVTRTFERAESQGLATLLDLHYSDEWADPSRQSPPADWTGVTSIDELASKLADYTTTVLKSLDAAGVLPTMVQIGNEINGGLVKDQVGLDWSHDGPLLVAGAAAVRAVAEETGSEISVVLHVAQPENALSWFADAARNGLTDFDVIGLSYYPQWSRFSVAELGNAVQQLAVAYEKEVLVVETGYPWTTEGAGDTADNVLDQALRQYPTSPAGQQAFMADLMTSVVANGGMGTVYWEPAWLSTDCRTRWGQGSHWENATLFDFQGVLGEGARYLSGSYSRPARPAGAAATADDPAGDATLPAADLTRVSGVMDADVIEVSVTLAGDPRHTDGFVVLAFDVAPGGGDAGRRPFDFEDSQRPELVLETSFHDEPGVGYASPVLTAWVDGEWSEGTFTGSVSVAEDGEEATTVTWTIPIGVMGGNAPIGVTVLTAQRGRAGDLDDTFGGGTNTVGVSVVLSTGEQ